MDYISKLNSNPVDTSVAKLSTVLVLISLWALLGCGRSATKERLEMPLANGSITKQVARLVEVQMRPQEPVNDPPSFGRLPQPNDVCSVLEAQEGTIIDCAKSERSSSYIEGTAIGNNLWTYHNVAYDQRIQGSNILPELIFYPKSDGVTTFDSAYKIYKWNLTD